MKLKNPKRLDTLFHLTFIAGTDNFHSAGCDSGAHAPMPKDERGLDPAEISEIAAFIDQCSVDVWMRVRTQLQVEWAANRIRLQEALELSGHRKAAQLSRCVPSEYQAHVAFASLRMQRNFRTLQTPWRHLVRLIMQSAAYVCRWGVSRSARKHLRESYASNQREKFWLTSSRSTCGGYLV